MGLLWHSVTDSFRLVQPLFRKIASYFYSPGLQRFTELRRLLHIANLAENSFLVNDIAAQRARRLKLGVQLTASLLGATGCWVVLQLSARILGLASTPKLPQDFVFAAVYCTIVLVEAGFLVYLGIVAWRRFSPRFLQQLVYALAAAVVVALHAKGVLNLPATGHARTLKLISLALGVLLLGVACHVAVARIGRLLFAAPIADMPQPRR